MSQQYLLPCEGCGATHSVGAPQAGSSFACECGRTVHAPTLRGMRSLLKPAVADKKPRHSLGGWSSLQGFLFAFGLVLLLVGGVVMFVIKREVDFYDITKPELPPDRQYNPETDNFEPADLLVRWRMMEKEGIGDYRPPPYVVHRKIVAKYQPGLIAAWVALGLGGAMALASLFVRPPRKR